MQAESVDVLAVIACRKEIEPDDFGSALADPQTEIGPALDRLLRTAGRG